MTQKDALKLLYEYCKVNGMHLTASSYNPKSYAIVVHDCPQYGNVAMDGEVPCHRVSGYHKPTELLIWIDGYNAGLQHNQTSEKGFPELRKA